jgi:hypothetical protein
MTSVKLNFLCGSLWNNETHLLFHGVTQRKLSFTEIITDNFLGDPLQNFKKT